MGGGVPAVSQTCILTCLSSIRRVFVANYTPMVGLDYSEKVLWANRDRMLVLPTPESIITGGLPPIKTSLKR